VHLVLSGEGPSDLGLFSQFKNEFIAGSMYYIIDKLIEQKYEYSFYDNKKDTITFVPKIELKKISKKLPPYTGKKGLQGTGYFINNAIALAKIAKEKSQKLDDDEVIAILFRDSDGANSSDTTLWQDKVNSINQGFKIEKFDRGVAMVPKPKSEAWLICTLKEYPYHNCETLEERSGNDNSPNNLKDELAGYDISHAQINEMIQNGEIDINQIDMPSFLYFKDSLKELL